MADQTAFEPFGPHPEQLGQLALLDRPVSAGGHEDGDHLVLDAGLLEARHEGGEHRWRRGGAGRVVDDHEQGSTPREEGIETGEGAFEERSPLRLGNVVRLVDPQELLFGDREGEVSFAGVRYRCGHCFSFCARSRSHARSIASMSGIFLPERKRIIAPPAVQT